VSLVADGVGLSGLPLVLALALSAYLVPVQPAVGGWSQRRFERAAHADPVARIARYRRTVLLEWALVAVALLVVRLAPRLDLGDVGVRWPGLSGGAGPFTVIGTAGLAVSAALLVALRRRVARERVPVSAPRQVLALLPRTARERQVFVWLAVTAGMCEETLYRGFLLAVAAALAPGLSPWWAVTVAALAFGAAHAYQGAGGVVATGVLGGCLAIIYLGSGSLLLPVLYHVLVDLRALVLTATRPRHAA
jgi:uncharacterized protein